MKLINKEDKQPYGSRNGSRQDVHPINGSINLVSNSIIQPIKFILPTATNKLNMEIYNTLGQCIINITVQNSSNYPVNDLLPGMYFAIINDAENTIARQKFVIR